jgi:hypothetical protein
MDPEGVNGVREYGCKSAKECGLKKGKKNKED